MVETGDGHQHGGAIDQTHIGKKNSQFCEDGGGETWALLASLLNTAKLKGVDPQTSLDGCS